MAHAIVKLSLIESIFGSISVVACLAVIVTYFMFSDIRSLRYVELVFYVSVNDFIGSIGVSLGSNPDHSFACWFQGLASNINYLSSVLWTTVISYQLWLAVFEGKTLQDMKYIHLVCWGFPIVWALLPLTTNTYGNTEDDQSAWCFIAERPDSPPWGLLVWEWLSFYAWIWLTIIANVTMLGQIHFKLREILQTGITSAEMAQKLVQKVNKLVYYPLILLVCWAPSTVIDMLSVVSKPDEEAGGFQVGNRISTILACSQGLFLAIAFFSMNPVIRYKWVGWWLSKPVVYKNRVTQQYTFDPDDEDRESDRVSAFSVIEEDDYVGPRISGATNTSNAAAQGSDLSGSVDRASNGTARSFASSHASLRSKEVGMRTFSFTSFNSRGGASRAQSSGSESEPSRQNSKNLDAVTSVLNPIFEDGDPFSSA